MYKLYYVKQTLHIFFDFSLSSRWSESSSRSNDNQRGKEMKLFLIPITS